MPNPPSLPDSTHSRNGNGTSSRTDGAPASRVSPPTGANHGLPTFLAPFLGAFAAVFVLALIGLVGYFAVTAFHSSSSGSKSKNLLMDVSSWNAGTATAKTLSDNDQPDIGWWASTFDLPKTDAVTDYLKKQGLNVSRLEPAHYESTPSATIITYHVYAEVPQQLLHLQQTAWQPTDPDARRFERVLVLNDGLPAGTMWNTQSPTVAAEAGAKLNFAWQVQWDKNYNVVETDRLPLSAGVFTQEQVSQYQTEASNTLSELQSQIQQINTRVQSQVQAQLAQVAPDPPKPEMLSSKWGGDGSGEPTKSAERIGGGTAAGAAGGAAFGAAAGDAGLGAGIGAGVGLLGGIIYDTVSKNNDKARYQRKIAAENEERLDDWHAQLKALKQQRNQITQEGLAERDRELTDLENRIVANKGHLEGIASATVTPTETTITPVQDAPPAQPTSDTPSGPVRQP